MCLNRGHERTAALPPSAPSSWLHHPLRINPSDGLPRRGDLDWSHKVSLVLEAARGMEVMAASGFVHLDVKAPNVLVSSIAGLPDAARVVQTETVVKVRGGCGWSSSFSC